jgi:hypothetical protein
MADIRVSPVNGEELAWIFHGKIQNSPYNLEGEVFKKIFKRNYLHRTRGFTNICFLKQLPFKRTFFQAGSYIRTL